MSEHEEHHGGGSSVRTYILIALILGVITYIEFALVEYQETWFAWMSGGAIIFWLVALSVLKFLLVVMFFMHLKQDDRTFTGLFSSGMVLAVGILFGLSALFTVRSLSYAQTPQEEEEAHAEAFATNVGDGAHVYEEACSSCHGEDGRGVEDAIPPHVGHTPLLAQAEGGVGGRTYMISVVLHGLEGEITVGGTSYDGIMAPLEELSDEEVAGVLNYSVSAWGNERLLPEDFAPFTAEEVAEVRTGEERSRFAVYELRSALNIPQAEQVAVAEGPLEHVFEYPPPKDLDVTEINIDPRGLGATEQSAPYEPGAPAEEVGEQTSQEEEALAAEEDRETEPTPTGDGDQDPLYAQGVPTEDDADLSDVTVDANVPRAEAPQGRVTIQNPFAPGAPTPAQPEGPRGAAPAQQGQAGQGQAQQGGQGEGEEGAPAAGAVPEVLTAGQGAYEANCASCHQATGQGVPGAFPPLVGHVPELYNAQGGHDYLINLLLYGLQGEIQVEGQTYNGVMPAWQQLSDEEIASILNYTATAWGNNEQLQNFEPYEAADITPLRDAGLSAQDVYNLRQKLELP